MIDYTNYVPAPSKEALAIHISPGMETPDGFTKFQIISSAGLLINWTVMIFLTQGFNIWYIWASAIGILMAFVWNYKMNRGYTWTEQ